VDWQLEAVHSELECNRVSIVRDAEGQSSWSSLVELRADPEHTLSILANVPPSTLGVLLSRLDANHWLIQAHAGTGNVFAARRELGTENGFSELLKESESIRAVAAASGGNSILPHCPTSWKPHMKIWGEARSDWTWMERVKATLDPHHALNPGRF